MMNRENGTFDEMFGVHPHLSGEALAGYVGGSLSADRLKRVEDHLAVCEACREEVVAVSTAVARAVSDGHSIDTLIDTILGLDIQDPVPETSQSDFARPSLRLIEGGGVGGAESAGHAWPSGLTSKRRFSGRRRAAASDSEVYVTAPAAGSAEVPRQAYIFVLTQGAFRVLESSGRLYLEFLDGSAPANLILDGEPHELVPSQEYAGLLAAPSLRRKALDALDYAYRRDPGGVDVRWC